MIFIRVLKLIFSIFDYLGSEIIKFILRLGGAKIGKNTYVSLSSRIYAKKINIGNDCKIMSNVKIKGNNIEIGNTCIISENSIITGNANFQLNDKSYIGKKVRINLSRDVIISYDVGIGENSCIWTHGYFPPLDEGYPVTYDQVEIEKNVWISSNVTILPGRKLKEGTIVGAGAIVTKDFPENSLIAGNPAKYIKSVSEIMTGITFIDSMKQIFANYPKISCVESNENLLIYSVNNHLIYVVTGNINIDLNKIPIKNSIFILKDLNHKYNLIDKYLWIDLTINCRKVKHSKNRTLIYLISILRDFGIRLVTDYEK
jgi:acetyltransferase-like isoleucine patch superfamily enzyme